MMTIKPVGPLGALSQLMKNRHLIGMMVRRDLSARYRGSVMGVLWAVLTPLAMLALYTFVFSVILQVKFGAGGDTASFALYLFCGMLPWLAFSEGIQRSTTVILENANLVKKVVFPLEILPLNVVLAAVVTQIVGTMVLLIVALAMGVSLSWTWLFAPVLLLPQVALTLGLGWFLASFGVFVRDITQVIGLLLTAGMFVTPIMYPASMIPAQFQWWLAVNPLAALIQAYRRVFLEGGLPPLSSLLALTLVGGLVGLFGYAWFVKTKNGFADVL
jgi:lipopolysaccharide transport system permease protein